MKEKIKPKKSLIKNALLFTTILGATIVGLTTIKNQELKKDYEKSLIELKASKENYSSSINNELNLKSQVLDSKTQICSLLGEKISLLKENNYLLTEFSNLTKRVDKEQNYLDSCNYRNANCLQKVINLQEDNIKISEEFLSLHETISNGGIPSNILPEEVSASPVNESLNYRLDKDIKKLMEKGKIDSSLKEMYLDLRFEDLIDSANGDLAKMEVNSYEEAIKKINDIPHAAAYILRFKKGESNYASLKNAYGKDTIDCLDGAIIVSALLRDNGFKPYLLLMNFNDSTGHASYLYKSNKNNKFGTIDINNFACTRPKFNSLEEIISNFEKGFNSKILEYSIIRFNNEDYIDNKISNYSVVPLSYSKNKLQKE